MKNNWKIWLTLLAFAILNSPFCLRVSAQNYSIDWYKVAGGGGTSSGGQYSLSGTIGQPDASSVMTGGGYSLTGGFWSLISVVQSAGVPNLIIVPNGANNVELLWANTGTYTLLQTPNLTGSTWTTNTSSITTVNGTNSITITPPIGNLFFRLKQ